MFSETSHCWRCPEAPDDCEHLLPPALSQRLPAPRAQPKVCKEQHCWVANDENEAERSCASRSVMVTGPGINLDLLTPTL